MATGRWGIPGRRAVVRAERPLARAEVSSIALDDELVLYHGRTGEAHSLNHTGAYIWQRCDGSCTVGQLARDVASAFGISQRRALADVRDLVYALDKADLVARR